MSVIETKMNELQQKFNEAIKDNDIPAILELINQGADVNLATDGVSPLHLAIKRNNINIVKLLLNHNANVETKDEFDVTPIIRAITQKNIELIKLLIAKKANLNAENNFGDTPLLAAVNSGELDIVMLVVESSINLNLNVNDILALSDLKDDYHNQVADILFNNRNNISDIKVVDFFIKLGKYEQAKIISHELITLNPSLAEEYDTKFILLRLDLLQQPPLEQIENPTVPHVNIGWLKDRLLIENPHVYNPSSREQELFEIFDIKQVDVTQETFCSKGDIVDELLSIAKIEQLQEVLDITALHLLENQANHIFLTDINLSKKANGIVEFYNPNSKEVYIQKSYLKKFFKETLVHELSHLAINKVFEYNAEPYYMDDDYSVKQAYNSAIYNSLKNIYQKLHKKEVASFNNSYELGKAIVKSLSDISTFDSLGQFLFISSFLEVYNRYDQNDESREFIVRYEEQVAGGASEELLDIVQPLKQYIDDYVKPAMREYINNHPMNHLLVCHVEKYIDSKNELSYANGTCVIQELGIINQNIQEHF